MCLLVQPYPAVSHLPWELFIHYALFSLTHTISPHHTTPNRLTPHTLERPGSKHWLFLHCVLRTLVVAALVIMPDLTDGLYQTAPFPPTHTHTPKRRFQAPTQEARAARHMNRIWQTKYS